MQLRPAHLVSFVVLAIAACSLTTIPDLTSGNAGAPGADAGGDANLPGAGDDAGDAGQTPFCSSLTPAPAFCDDFDGDPNLGGRWTEVRAFAGVFGVELDTSAARSSPRSLVSRVGPGAPGCAYATAVKELSGAYTAVRLAYSVRIDEASKLSEPSVIGVVVIGGGNSQCQLYLSASESTFLVGEQIIHPSAPPEERSYQVRPLLPIAAWRRVEIDYDLGAKKLAVVIDGQNAVAADTALACPYTPGNAIAHVGLFCEPERDVIREVRYDDVTVTVR